jgi:hypothetical protein
MFGIPIDIACIGRDYDAAGNPVLYVAPCLASMPGGLVAHASQNLKYILSLYSRTRLYEYDPSSPYQIKTRYMVGQTKHTATFIFVFPTYSSLAELRHGFVFCCIDGIKWEKKTLPEYRANLGFDPNNTLKFRRPNLDD